MSSVTDPWFLKGAANPKDEGVSLLIWPIFQKKKLYENEEQIDGGIRTYNPLPWTSRNSK